MFTLIWIVHTVLFSLLTLLVYNARFSINSGGRLNSFAPVLLPATISFVVLNVTLGYFAPVTTIGLSLINSVGLLFIAVFLGNSEDTHKETNATWILSCIFLIINIVGSFLAWASA